MIRFHFGGNRIRLIGLFYFLCFVMIFRFWAWVNYIYEALNSSILQVWTFTKFQVEALHCFRLKSFNVSGSSPSAPAQGRLKLRHISIHPDSNRRDTCLAGQAGSMWRWVVLINTKATSVRVIIMGWQDHKNCIENCLLGLKRINTSRYKFSSLHSENPPASPARQARCDASQPSLPCVWRKARC